MIHTGCDPSIFSFSHWNTSVIFFSKKHHILTSWVIQALFKEVGLYQYVLFSRILTSENLGSLNILEGIHVILFPFLIAPGYIPDAPSSDKETAHWRQGVKKLQGLSRTIRHIASRIEKDWLLFWRYIFKSHLTRDESCTWRWILPRMELFTVSEPATTCSY